MHRRAGLQPGRGPRPRHGVAAPDLHLLAAAQRPGEALKPAVVAGDGDRGASGQSRRVDGVDQALHVGVDVGEGGGIGGLLGIGGHGTEALQQGRLGRDGWTGRTGFLGGVRWERTDNEADGWVRARVLSTAAQQAADAAQGDADAASGLAGTAKQAAEVAKVKATSLPALTSALKVAGIAVP